MVNTVRVNADHGHDFHPLADHDKVKKFYQGGNSEFSAFPFLLQLNV